MTLITLIRVCLFRALGGAKAGKSEVAKVGGSDAKSEASRASASGGAVALSRTLVRPNNAHVALAWAGPVSAPMRR